MTKKIKVGLILVIAAFASFAFLLNTRRINVDLEQNDNLSNDLVSESEQEVMVDITLGDITLFGDVSLHSSQGLDERYVIHNDGTGCRYFRVMENFVQEFDYYRISISKEFIGQTLQLKDIKLSDNFSLISVTEPYQVKEGSNSFDLKLHNNNDGTEMDYNFVVIVKEVDNIKIKDIIIGKSILDEIKTVDGIMYLKLGDGFEFNTLEFKVETAESNAKIRLTAKFNDGNPSNPNDVVKST